MKKYIILSLLTFCAVVPGYSTGDDAGNFSDIIERILSNNPDLKSRRLEMNQNVLEASDANALNNPEVAVTQVWGDKGVGNKFEVEVSQSFDWPGVYRSRSQAAKKGFAAAEMLYHSACIDLALQAKQKLIELVYLNQQLALLQRIKENTDSVQAKVEEGYRGGELTILDSKKMQIEQYKVANDITDVSEAILMLKTDIQSLCPGEKLNLDGLDSYPVEPRRDADDYLAEIAELDPVIAAGKFTAEQEALNAKAARQQRLPGFSVGYIYQKEMGDMFNGFTVSMSLPFFQNRKGREIALSRAENARLTNASIEANRRAEVNTALAQMKIHQLQIEDYDRIFGDNSYLSLLLQAYRGGQINVIDYLSEVNYFYDTTKAYLNAKYQYSLSLASLNRYSSLYK